MSRLSGATDSVRTAGQAKVHGGSLREVGVGQHHPSCRVDLHGQGTVGGYFAPVAVGGQPEPAGSISEGDRELRSPFFFSGCTSFCRVWLSDRTTASDSRREELP
jgi:hypothetical protein